jgi:hypothetical protein
VTVADDKALAKIDAATRALAEARTAADVLTVRDAAAAIGHVLRQMRASLGAQNAAAELRLRCERRVGEMLAANPDYGRGKKSLTVSDLGIDDNAATRYQHLAALPDEEFEAHIRTARDEGLELTTAGLLRLWQALNRPPSPAPADWRRRPVADLGLRTLLAGAVEMAGARTAGQLQDRLDRGETLGLSDGDRADLRLALAGLRGEPGAGPCPACGGTGRAK